MKSFKRGFLPFATFAAVAFFITLTCCTKVDDRLGLGFIPDDQKTKVGVAELGALTAADQEIKAFVTYTDTVYTQNQGVGFFGKLKSDIFGLTSTASVMQFLPSDIRTDTINGTFGIRPTVDSVKFLATIQHMGGNMETEQTFNIYRLKDSLNVADTSYYMSYPWRENIDPAPLFTFKYKGSGSTDLEYIKTEITPQGEAYVNELLSDSKYYDDHYKLKDKFFGLVFAPADESPEDGSVYFTSLAYSYFLVYFHNYKTETGNEIKDEAVMQMYKFDDNRYTDSKGKVLPRSNSVVCISHDYTGTIFDGVSYEPMEMPGGYGYVQGLGGVTTVLEFPDALFEAMDALKEEETDDIFISQAHLYLTLKDGDDTEALNKAHQKLGSYRDYPTQHPIPDYSYYDEGNGSEIAYNGELNRTFGYYMMDISSFLHLANKESLDRKFTLAPIAYPNLPNEALNWKETVLKIDAGAPARIKMTYILIK